MTSAQPDDKVLDHTRQQLSALFDGELGLDEARFLQRRLEHDATLAASWSRWQLAGDALRGRAVAAAPPGFAEQVAARIFAAEGAPARVAGAARRSRLLPGAALAASVAALAMFMTRQAPEVAPPPAPTMQVASAADTVPAAPQQAPVPVAPATPDPLPGGVLEAAGSAIAVAEVPRRAAERRSRAQQQRAAATRTQRVAAEPRLVAAAAATGTEAPANPFVPEAAAEVITTRPWPRALLPGSDAFTVGYGRLQQGAVSAHPFQPRPVALPQAPLATASAPAPDPASTSEPEDTD